MMVLVAVLMVALLGLTGFAIDAGRLLLTSRTLQATSDDAALAGAITLPASNATSVATQYSSVAGYANARTMLNGAAMVSGFPVVQCLSSLQNQGYVCNSPGNGNAVQVKQQVTVATPFMSLLGYRQVTMTAISTARTGLVELGTGTSAWYVFSSPNNAYNGYVVNTNNSGIPGAWLTPSANTYPDTDVSWVIPPGGNGSANSNYPSGAYYYVSNVVTGITGITQGLVNADDGVSIYLYDVTSNATQVGGTFSSSGDCSGNGGYGIFCNAPLTFSYSGLSIAHSYRLLAAVNNGGGPTGLLLQAKGFGPAALYHDR